MPDTQHIPSVTIKPDRKFPESGWFERPDRGQAIPFEQSASGEVGVQAGISPHQLFGFFTVDIILEHKVFVR